MSIETRGAVSRRPPAAATMPALLRIPSTSFTFTARHSAPAETACRTTPSLPT